MKPEPTKAVCHKTYYPAYRSSGSRPLSRVRWIVLHSTEGGTAESVARYFFGPSAGGSTHLVVDDAECQRCLPNSAVCWGALSAPSISANQYGFHIEMCGYARWSAVIWRSHWRTLQRAAYKTAFHAKKFGIPLRWLSPADILANRPGITSHVNISRASKKADPGRASRYSHWDPGPLWPKWLFMRLVRKYAKELL